VATLIKSVDRCVRASNQPEQAGLDVLKAHHGVNRLFDHANELDAQALFGLGHGGGRSDRYFVAMRAIAIGSCRSTA
jgi:hypothetical protein